jgi:hypothetical protein
MLRRIDLENFKAFERFTIRFRGDAFLVGPNNAGKSTAIAALRVGASMLRTAKRFRATDSEELDGTIRWGHAFTAGSVGLVHENLRHEFRQSDTRIRLVFDGDSELVAVWKPGDDSGGFFYVRHKDVTLRQPKEIRRVFPDMGLVPVLSPIDTEEEPLSEKYVRANLDGRLASRHFRNQLYLLERDWIDGRSAFEEFCSFAEPWLTEITLGQLRLSGGIDHAGLDLFYREVGSTREKEISWVGDGMQIWIQLLLHIYRLRREDVIVLDEPDVFLHADLQRRLVDLLESLDAQTITATHSAEIVAEAGSESIIWVSRNRKRAVVAPDDRLLFELSDSLGTGFNLPLARTLRARCVLFVEGKDVKILRRVARTLGAGHIDREEDLAVIALEGVERSEHLAAFAWLVDNVLGNAVRTFVVLDRDYRDGPTITAIEKELRAAGIEPHVWRRHELENYLIHPSAIARVSGAPIEWVKQQLAEAVEGFEEDVYSGIAAAMDRRLRKKGIDAKEIAKRAKKEADGVWKDPAKRQNACPGKELLSRVNERLQTAGHRAVRPRLLAERLLADEIPAEMRQLLVDVDAAAGP